MNSLSMGLLRRCYCVLPLMLCSLAFRVPAQTTNPAYLADMPSVDRVKAQIQGKDATDTAARQIAVFTYLQEYIKRIAYNKNVRAPYTPDEMRILTAYSTVAYQMQQDYNKSHTPDEAKAFDTLQFNYMLNNGDQWSRALIGPQTAAAYTGTLNQMNARQQAHVDSINRANEEAKAAAASSSASGGNTNDPTALATRRCAELGGTVGGCATKSFGQGLMAMVGGDQLSNMVESVQTIGVYLSGNYHNPSTTAQFNFALNAARLTGCGKLVADERAYNLRRTPSGIQVTIANEPAPITLALHPDGMLAGPGTIDIKGRIITGYSSTTTTLVHQDGSEASNCNGAYGSCRTTTSTPIYAPAMARCNIAALSPPAPAAPVKTGAAADDGSMLGALTAFGSSVVATTEPGLRMNGKFASSTGLLLDFEGDAVTLDCGLAHVKAPYTVQNLPGEFRISVNNPGGPFTLTLAPDNALHGSASTTVNGRLFASMDNNGQTSFRPVSATCSVNAFSSNSPADYKALITNPPAPGR